MSGTTKATTSSGDSRSEVHRGAAEPHQGEDQDIGDRVVESVAVGVHVGDPHRDEGERDHDQHGPPAEAVPGEPPGQGPDGQRDPPGEEDPHHRDQAGRQPGGDHQERAGEHQGGGRDPPGQDDVRASRRPRSGGRPPKGATPHLDIGAGESHLEGPGGRGARTPRSTGRPATARPGRLGGPGRGCTVRRSATVPAPPHEESPDEPVPLHRSSTRPPHPARPGDAPRRGARHPAVDGGRRGPRRGRPGSARAPCTAATTSTTTS